MAIYFIHTGGYDMGNMMYTSAKDGSETMVGIEHLTRNGYRLSKGGEVIKEQLPLKGFIERLVRVEEFQLGFSYIETKVQKDMYIIHKALTERNSGKIHSIAEWLDERYSRLIREKKLTLMEHNYNVNVKHASHRSEIDVRETISNSERAIYQVQHGDISMSDYMKKQHPMTPDEAFQKGITDDEVYYLTTL